jgi:hypothetical protein
VAVRCAAVRCGRACVRVPECAAMRDPEDQQRSSAPRRLCWAESSRAARPRSV